MRTWPASISSISIPINPGRRFCPICRNASRSVNASRRRGGLVPGDPGGTHAARASSNDEQIDVELSHGYPARILSFDALSSREPASTSLENALAI